MDVIQVFLRNNDLSMHNYSDDELFNHLNISKLKPILKKKNMKVSGKKQDLIDRLVQSGEIGSHHVDHTNLKHYIITKQGRVIVLPYLKNLELTKEKASTRVTDFIAKKEYSKAYEVVMEYQMQLPSTMRGEGLSVGIGLESYATNSEKQKVEIGKWRLDQIQAVRNIANEFPRDMIQKAYEFIMWNKSIRGSPFTPSFISAFMTSSNTIYNWNELDHIKKEKMDNNCFNFFFT